MADITTVIPLDDKAEQDDTFAQLSLEEAGHSPDEEPYDMAKLPTEIQDEIFAHLSPVEVEPFLWSYATYSSARA